MKHLFIILTLIFSTALFNSSNAQTVMQLDRMDCNGMKHDLFSDLDSGKAVVLFFWMPNCSSCPPPAKKILAMMNNNKPLKRMCKGRTGCIKALRKVLSAWTKPTPG